MNFTKLSRKYVRITLNGTNADGSPATISNAVVALTPQRDTINEATVWYSTTYSNGVATVLLVGSDADPTGGVVLSDLGNDLWIKIADGAEVDAVLVGRINMY
jgi:hypothetical protein